MKVGEEEGGGSASNTVLGGLLVHGVPCYLLFGYECTQKQSPYLLSPLVSECIRWFNST
jgi:hypothetical protein